MAAIEDGLYQPSMKAPMVELEREKAEVTARLAEAPQGIRDVHPAIAEIYKRKVARLTETFVDPECDSRPQATSVRSSAGSCCIRVISAARCAPLSTARSWAFLTSSTALRNPAPPEL